MNRVTHFLLAPVRRTLASLALASVMLLSQHSPTQGQILYISDAGSGNIDRFNANTGAFQDIFIPGLSIVTGLATTDNKLFAAISAPNGGGKVEVFNKTTGSHLSTFKTGLDLPEGVDISYDGKTLYVAEYDANRVRSYDVASGNLLQTASFTGAFGVRVAPDGSVYVAGQNGGGVERFDANLNPLGTFIPGGANGLVRPIATVFGLDGYFYVLDSEADIVQRYDLNGNYLNTLSAPAGALDFPFDMDIGPDGNLYVASSGGQCVARFDLTGQTFLDNFIANPNAGQYPKFMLFDPYYRPTNVPEAGTVAIIVGVVTGGLVLRRRASRPRR